MRKSMEGLPVETAITDQNCQNLPVEISKYVSGVYTM
jgi:hypothetical protein